MGNLKIPDYRNEIEETVIPDNDSKNTEPDQNTVQTESDSGAGRTEGNNEEEESRKSFVAVAMDKIFEFFVAAGQYFCHIIADFFSKPAVYVVHGAKFVWKHTALFRDAVERTFKEIGNFFFSPLIKSKRVLQRTNKQIKAAKEQGDNKKAARLYGSIAKNAVFGKQGLAVTLFNYAAPIIAIVFLMSVVGYATGTNYAIKLTVDGKFVGYVESEQVFNDAERIMQERITYIGNEKKITMEPSYSLEMLGDQEYLTKYQLANKLLEMSDTPIEYAYGMYIGGKFYGALIDNTAVEAELKKILDGYRTNAKDEDVAFEKDIEYVPGLYLSDSIVSSDEIIKLVNSKKEEAAYYTVVEGDSHSGICSKLGISMDELEALNPGIMDAVSYTHLTLPTKRIV